MLAAVAAASAALAACSSQGGAQNQARQRSSGGGGDTSGSNLTIQMITHEQAGDTFWDKIRAGARGRGEGARDHPAVLEQRERPRAGHAGAERDRQQGLRHRGHPVQRGRGGPGGRRRPPRPGSRWWRSTRASTDYKEAGAKMYFGSDETLAGQTVGQKLTARTAAARRCASSRRRARWRWRPAAPGVKQGFPNTENLQVNGADLPSVQQTIQSKLAAGPVDHQHRDPGCADRPGRAAGPGGGGQHRRSSPRST